MKKTGKNIKCLICKEEFYVPMCYLKSKKYCSRQCFIKSQFNRIPWNKDIKFPELCGENNPNWKRIEKNCEICKKIFFARQDLVKIKRGRFCSTKCRGIWQSQVIRGENHPKYGKKTGPLSKKHREKIGIANKNIKHTKKWNKKISKAMRGKKLSEIHRANIIKTKSKNAVYLICKVCNKQYRIRPSAVIYHNPQYCSIKCSGIAKSGKNSIFWNGGTSTLRQKLFNTKQYKQWRSQCFQRDNYACQECKKRGGKLHCHHQIISFSTIINSLKQWCDEFKLDLYESALKFTPLWDINNGQTLCIDCHKKTDTYLRREVRGVINCQ